VERKSGGLFLDIIATSDGRDWGKGNILDGFQTSNRNHDNEAKKVKLRFLALIRSFNDVV
jgi:hypothetical protein